MAAGFDLNRPAWWHGTFDRVVVAKWLCAVLLLVRVIAVFRFQHDIDESQNLHVVYGWIGGELPYRDRFDNHAPLFAWMFAPLAWLVGESVHVVVFARLALLPFGLAALWMIFLIARRVADREVAWWTVTICLALADWSLKSVEFRPDVIWALLWFATLWMLVRRVDRLGIPDAIVMGVMLGLCLLASIKTTLLVPSLALAILLGMILSPVLRKSLTGMRWVWFGFVVFIGFLIPPVLGFGSLMVVGTTLDQIRFCLFDVNQSSLEPWRLISAAVAFPVMVWGAIWIYRSDDPRRASMGILFVTASTYLILLLAMAPELRKQTFLVVYPLVILLVLQYTKSLKWSSPVWRGCVVAVCLVAFAHQLVEARLWRDGMQAQRELLSEVLELTDKHDYLLDGRGETIFADRPVYLAFVAVTTSAVEANTLESPDMESLARNPTAVAIGNLDGLPRAVRQYLKDHYLLSDDGLLRVSGQVLEPSWVDGRWIERVPVALPGDYVIVKDGQVVDRVPVTQAGMQQFDFGSDRSRRYLIWEDAWQNGFRPDETDG